MSDHRRSTRAPRRAQRTLGRGPRLAAIRRIIAGAAVDSQERLIDLLGREGFAATQATLSRDLKYLGIGKVPEAEGKGYTYTMTETESEPAAKASLVQDFRRGFVSLQFSGAFGLVKTLPGHAASVASALDHLRIAEILGTVAGDDTILIVPRDGVGRARLRKSLGARIPGL